jgi:hypothetical protein
MCIECAYSFADLFKAAVKREPASEELKSLYALPQTVRNEKVKEWAEIAGWETRERTGSDGKIYVAFAPNFEK